MSQGTPVDHALILDYVIDHIAETGKRPSQQDVADRFGIAINTVGKVLTVAELNGAIPPKPRAEQPVRRTNNRYAEAQPEVLKFLIEYFDENRWMPSQREVADRFGWPLSKASRILHYLRGSGLIHMGPDPRQIRIIGTDMKAPDQ